MLRVKLTTSFPDWPLIRQTPGGNGVWGDCQFFINQDIDECDYWVVMDDLPAAETTRCPPQNTIFISAEPPSVKPHDSRFCAQFATLVTCQRQIRHPHTIYSQQGFPWHVKSQSYDDLIAMPRLPKPKLLSVISSDKAFTEGHRQRLAFVEQVKTHFGDTIDIFGRGINEVSDKWDTLVDYQYSIAIENFACADYWTEKLADCYLAQCFPLYHGCPNLDKYFAPNAFARIDIAAPDAAIKAIENAIAQNYYETRQEALSAAKRLVSNRYQLFPLISDLIEGMTASKVKQTVKVRPHILYTSSLMGRVARAISEKVH